MVYFYLMENLSAQEAGSGDAPAVSTTVGLPGRFFI